VAVADVKVRAQEAEVERHLSRRVGAIDHRDHPRLPRETVPRETDQIRDGEKKRGKRRDVGNRDHSDRGIDPLSEGIENRPGGGGRKGERDLDQPRPGFLRKNPPHAIDRAVFMVSGQDRVAGADAQRPCHEVHPVGGVADKREIVRAGSQEAGEARPRATHLRPEVALQEVNRLTLQLALVLKSAFKNHGVHRLH
jgi:hypothetical protein